VEKNSIRNVEGSESDRPNRATAGSVLKAEPTVGKKHSYLDPWGQVTILDVCMNSQS